MAAFNSQKEAELSANTLRDLYDYDPLTGVFVSKVGRRGIAKGVPAGHVGSHGYNVIQVMWRPYQAHRLAWLYMTGEWPSHFIDHIDGDRANNAWANLRPATYADNNANSALSRRNTSGQRGVCFVANDGLWRAQLNRNGKIAYRGWFRSFDEAKAAYLEASRIHHGEYAR